MLVVVLFVKEEEEEEEEMVLLVSMQNDHNNDPTEVEQTALEDVIKKTRTPTSKKVVTFNTKQNKYYKRRGALWNKHELFYSPKELQEMKKDATKHAQTINGIRRMMPQ